jgi:hypothetical protein
MKAMPREFDWGRFIVCQVPIVVLTTLWLVQGVRKNGDFGTFLLVGLVFVVLSVWNYLRAKNTASRLN